jgi:hypothetical protein
MASSASLSGCWAAGLRHCRTSPPHGPIQEMSPWLSKSCWYRYAFCLT